LRRPVGSQGVIRKRQTDANDPKPQTSRVTEGRAEDIVYPIASERRPPMVDLSIIVHDAEERVRVSTASELDAVINMACEEARAQKMLNIVFLEAANGNVLSLVVGGDDTVLSFIHGHRNPPYFASRGAEASTHPVMTCYVGLVHHTEFPRKYIIPFEKGLIAAHEFAESEVLPQSIEWIET